MLEYDNLIVRICFFLLVLPDFVFTKILHRSSALFVISSIIGFIQVINSVCAYQSNCPVFLQNMVLGSMRPKIIKFQSELSLNNNYCSFFTLSFLPYNINPKIGKTSAWMCLKITESSVKINQT